MLFDFLFPNFWIMKNWYLRVIGLLRYLFVCLQPCQCLQKLAKGVDETHLRLVSSMPKQTSILITQLPLSTNFSFFKNWGTKNQVAWAQFILDNYVCHLQIISYLSNELLTNHWSPNYSHFNAAQLMIIWFG